MKIQYIKDIDSLCGLIKEFGGEYPVIEGNKPLKRIISLLEREREYINKEYISVIITEDYLDEEWLKEYGEYYKKTFLAAGGKIIQTSIKLDFFIGRIDNISEISTLDNDDFLGYMIIRPLPAQRVCEAVIKIPTENRRNYFIICKALYSSKIENHQFEIVGFPFVQQEIITGVCAHACLRMISLYLSRRYGTKALFIPEIDDIAEEVPTESFSMVNISAGGLWTPHIYRVFKEMNCKSLIYDFTRKEKSPYQPNELIYPYIESGFPVLVGLQTEKTGHSVVVIGHTFDQNSWWPEAKSNYYRELLPPRPPCLKSFAWTDFIIQDDNFGPYLTMPRDFPLIIAVAVPIPQNIPLMIPIEDAELIAYSYISDERTVKAILELEEEGEIEENEKRWIKMFYHHLMGGKLVLRTFLIEKQKLTESFAEKDTPSDVKTFYSLLTAPEVKIPDMVWLTEISVPELFSHKRYSFGEVIIDPTCPINIFGSDKAIIAIHLPGIIFWNDFEENQLSLIRTKDDVPYQHIIRF